MAEVEPLATESAGPGSAAPDIESQIKTAMASRVAHFRKQADSLTFEGVRRLVEKDLGLEMHALDVHKTFIKQCLLECLGGSDNADAPKDSGETEQNDVSTDKGDVVESPERLEPKEDIKELSSENEDKMEDSPVMGLLNASEITKSNAKGMKDNGKKADVTEGTIMKAIRKRASYFRANAEKVTMAAARRLLEEDLELEKRALDIHKAFIGQQLEKILESPEEKTSKKSAQRKASKEVAKEGSSDSSSSGEDEEEEEEVKPRKKTATKGKMQKSEGLKKRKTPASKEAKASNKKRIKPEPASSDSNREDRGHSSEDDESRSSAEKRRQKKEVSAPAYGKRVERLKSVIKSCGMSVPPSIYKKAKQAPEDKRESYLIKELEEILSREGLSSNPSEKEIKEVKKRKDRARELEGIDTSNIVSSSRRRTTSSYVPPPKPKIPVESEGEGSEDTDDDGEDEDDEEEDEENDGGNDDSQSEDAGEDAGEDESA